MMNHSEWRTIFIANNWFPNELYVNNDRMNIKLITCDSMTNIYIYIYIYIYILHLDLYFIFQIW
jgi:hypothetical protein